MFFSGLRVIMERIHTKIKSRLWQVIKLLGLLNTWALSLSKELTVSELFNSNKIVRLVWQWVLIFGLSQPSRKKYPKLEISKAKGCSPQKFFSSSTFSPQQFQLKVSWQASPVKTWSGCSGFCLAPAWDDEITDVSAEWKVHL